LPHGVRRRLFGLNFHRQAGQDIANTALGNGLARDETDLRQRHGWYGADPRAAL